MADRKQILDLLHNFKPADESEEKSLNKIKDFISTHEDCFENTFKLGHVTGSAFVVDKNFEFVLLNHHQKLNKWLQFGGRSDGHNIVADTAMREAVEESGLKSLKFCPDIKGIFDVDAHLIPEKGDMPSHYHYDVRFLVIGDKDEEFVVSNESKNIRWIRLEDVNNYNQSPEMLRMVNKVISLRH